MMLWRSSLMSGSKLIDPLAGCGYAWKARGEDMAVGPQPSRTATIPKSLQVQRFRTSPVGRL